MKISEQLIQMYRTKIALGKQLAELRKEQKRTTYTTFRDTNIPSQVVKSVIKGDKNYTINVLLKLLAEVGKTIKIVDL